MTASYPQHTPGAAAPEESTGIPPLLRGVMWVAIGALIAGAILCVFWVLLSPEGDVIPKAFLTIIALAAFAGMSLMDAQLAPGRTSWLVLVSMLSWVLVLLCALTLIWVPADNLFVVAKVWYFILIVLFVQLTVLHQRIVWRAHTRHTTGFTRTLTVITSVFIVALLFMALVPLTLPTYFDYPDMYGRIMVSLAILGAVGTALIPLITAMFGPKRVAAHVEAARTLPWPTYRDGVTPLPMLPDGQPDFDALRTGVPSPGARSFGSPPVQAPHHPNPGPQHPAPPAP
ncbi:MAG: hypothetical protein ACTH4Y_13605 [Microbacterium gubbeenense]|uniref:hypothetical protein n=1 Tax=Microbacterium gubbeenense TaxID=159896 RepID=UPI003F9C1F9A